MFFNHRLEYKNEMNYAGCIEIYDTLASNNNNRVLAFGEHPQIEQFPCIIESYLDVNIWGNKKLMRNQKNFLEFVDYIKYDYILIWKDSIKRDTVSYLNLLTLFDSEKVENLMIENHHILIKIGVNEGINKSSELKSEFEKEILLQQ